jgi:hypothetical protein
MLRLYSAVLLFGAFFVFAKLHLSEVDLPRLETLQLAQLSLSSRKIEFLEENTKQIDHVKMWRLENNEEKKRLTHFLRGSALYVRHDESIVEMGACTR